MKDACRTARGRESSIVDKFHEIEITSNMTEAGVEVADLIGFAWGVDCEETLVRRVFRAMYAVRQGRGRNEIFK